MVEGWEWQVASSRSFTRNIIQVRDGLSVARLKSRCDWLVLGNVPTNGAADCSVLILATNEVIKFSN